MTPEEKLRRETFFARRKEYRRLKMLGEHEKARALLLEAYRRFPDLAIKFGTEALAKELKIPKNKGGKKPAAGKPGKGEFRIIKAPQQGRRRRP